MCFAWRDQLLICINWTQSSSLYRIIVAVHGSKLGYKKKRKLAQKLTFAYRKQKLFWNHVIITKKLNDESRSWNEIMSVKKNCATVQSFLELFPSVYFGFSLVSAYSQSFLFIICFASSRTAMEMKIIKKTFLFPKRLFSKRYLINLNNKKLKAPSSLKSRVLLC